jgi:hypothetical protein
MAGTGITPCFYVPTATGPIAVIGADNFTDLDGTRN